MAPANPVIQLNNLRKEYDDLVAVDNISLAIPKGEIYGLIGPNGAGKTTTIRMACGLLSPTQGTMRVADVDVLADPERAQQHIGYLSDFFSVYEDLKVWEYLDYFAHAYKMPEEKITGRVNEVISQVALEVKRDAMIAGLSRGMKQRLGIGRAIIHRPDVLVLDEPASGLDPKSRLELRNLLLSLRDQGTTILISSHILTELEGFCTSIGIMERGHLVRSGSIEEVTAAAGQARMVSMRWLGNSVDAIRAALARHGVSDSDLKAGEGTFGFTGTDEELAQILGVMVATNVRIVEFSEIKQTVEDLYMKLSHHEVM